MFFIKMTPPLAKGLRATVLYFSLILDHKIGVPQCTEKIEIGPKPLLDWAPGQWAVLLLVIMEPWKQKLPCKSHTLPEPTVLRFSPNYGDRCQNIQHRPCFPLVTLNILWASVWTQAPLNLMSCYLCKQLWSERLVSHVRCALSNPIWHGWHEETHTDSHTHTHSQVLSQPAKSISMFHPHRKQAGGCCVDAELVVGKHLYKRVTLVSLLLDLYNYQCICLRLLLSENMPCKSGGGSTVSIDTAL